MLQSEFVPPDEQIFAYVKAKNTAREPVGKLLDIVAPDGKPDKIVYACLMRAHDLALLLGHSRYDCIHLVTSMVVDPEGRKKLTGIMASLEPPVILDPEGILRACTNHLSCQAKPIAVFERDWLEGSDALKAWFAAARVLIQGRSIEAQYIEVKHLVAAAKASAAAKDAAANERADVATIIVDEIVDAWQVLNASSVPTLEQRITSIKTDITDSKVEVQQWVESAMASITGAFGQVAKRVSDHEEQSIERIVDVKRILSIMHGAVDKVGERVDDHDQRSTGRMNELEAILGKIDRSIDAGEAAITRLHREIKSGFSMIDGGGTHGGKLHTTTVSIAQIYRDRIGLVWSSVSLLAAALVGGGAGFLLQP